MKSFVYGMLAFFVTYTFLCFITFIVARMTKKELTPEELSYFIGLGDVFGLISTLVAFAVFFYYLEI